MIATHPQLMAVLARGATVARLSVFEGAHDVPRWAIVPGGETVHERAVRAAEHHGDLAVIQRDLVGEPMQYARADPQP